MQKKEIRKIIKVYGFLGGNIEFPIRRILSFLFYEFSNVFPIPISLSKLESSLPQVLDKFDTILLIFDSLQDINSFKGSISELPDEWNEDLIEKGKKRIFEVASSLGFKDTDTLDECSLKMKLIEDEALWSQKSSDARLASNLTTQLNLLHASLYEQEIEPGYSDWEEKFTTEESIKKFMVMCDKCEKSFLVEADYQGVVNVEQRNMGPEYYHEWSTIVNCPECENEVEVVHELWEYPQFWYSGEDTDCIGCSLVRERKKEAPSSTLLDFT